MAPTAAATPDLAAIRARLERVGHGHVLKFWDRLGVAERRALLGQIDRIDWAALPGLIDKYVKDKPVFALPDGVEPAPFFSADPTQGAAGGSDAAALRRSWDAGAARAAGEDLLRRGKVACFTVAGGQGSRLGYDGPKGCYPGGAITGRPLFQFFAEGILAAQRRYGAPIPWAIMTSPLNH
ncbi:MAG: UTP--glucose-1-phosphate uridylyltransferase, partial [Phycisphaerales bacterium]|nr:UTP--glucose-1-phosphate uridylyltransferase [Phycisphaerales bacterium]